MNQLHRFRMPLALLGVFALAAGMWAGLIRIGWRLPPVDTGFALLHGPLMVAGFVGTLISLERVAVLNLRWGYIAPACTVMGALALLLGLPAQVGPLLITLGSLSLLALLTQALQTRPGLSTTTMALGSLSWVIGNGLWLTGLPIHSVVLWWIGFLVFMLVGQRMEYGRMHAMSHGVESTFLTAATILLLGLVICVVVYDLGVRIAGLGMVGLAVWLLAFDRGWRTERGTQLSRFIAACLVPGYIWLAVSGLAGVIYGNVQTGRLYDAWLHALFVGFVFTMVFAHTPVVLPSLFGVSMRFLRVFYAHLLLLHLSLLIRITGDLLGWPLVRQWGGMLNAVALVLFLLAMLFATRRARDPVQKRIPDPVPTPARRT